MELGQSKMHARFHEIDLMVAMVEEMKDKILWCVTLLYSLLWWMTLLTILMGRLKVNWMPSSTGLEKSPTRYVSCVLHLITFTCCVLSWLHLLSILVASTHICYIWSATCCVWSWLHRLSILVAWYPHLLHIICYMLCTILGA